MAAPNIVATTDVRPVTDYAAVTTTPAVLTENAADSGQVYKINSIVVSNVDGTNDATVTVDLYRNSTPYYIAYEVTVPAGGSLVVMSKDTSVYLIEGDQIRCSGSADGDLNISCSYEIISESEIDLSSGDTVPVIIDPYENWTDPDLSNGSYDSVSLSTGVPEPARLYVRPDGYAIYLSGSDNGSLIKEWPLSVPNDISSAGTPTTHDLEAIMDGSFTFSPDGTRFYCADELGTDTLRQFDLSTPWDISSRTQVNSVSIATNTPRSSQIYFKPDGTKVYFSDYDNGHVDEYNLSTPWDISTLSYVGSTGFLSNFGVAVFINDDGSKLYWGNNAGDQFEEYPLSIPYDVTSIGSLSASLNTSSFDTGTQGYTFSWDGTKMYYVGRFNDTIYQFSV